MTGTDETTDKLKAPRNLRHPTQSRVLRSFLQKLKGGPWYRGFKRLQIRRVPNAEDESQTNHLFHPRPREAPWREQSPFRPADYWSRAIRPSACRECLAGALSK